MPIEPLILREVEDIEWITLREGVGHCAVLEAFGREENMGVILPESGEELIEWHGARRANRDHPEKKLLTVTCDIYEVTVIVFFDFATAWQVVFLEQEGRQWRSGLTYMLSDDEMNQLISWLRKLWNI